MAEFSPQVPQKDESIPFWRDGRVLGVFAQIAFVIFVVVAATWLFNNVAQNISSLGAFRCADGSSSFRCGFEFLSLDAQFDISESVIEYDPSDPYARALLVGALNTAKVGFFGIILATLLGTITGIARLSSNWLISSVAKWYVDIMRNTPLLLQLFFLFFGVILLFPAIGEAIQPFGLPIYLSQRGINLPGLAFMPSFAIWLAFVVLGVLQAQALWIIFGRQEERTGKSSNRTLWIIVSFFVIVIIGWFAASASAEGNQGFLAARSLRVQDFDDLEALVLDRLDVDELADIEAAVAAGVLTEEDVESAAVSVCTVTDAPSSVNFMSQLNRRGIPFELVDENGLDQATTAFAAGECDVMVARSAALAAQRSLLEDPASLVIAPVAEVPVRIDVPRLEGLNFVGGVRMSPNFAAILIGLVLYTGAFIAEIVRAGIQSVAKGQTEAARALGLSEGQRLRLVVLPQALRVIIPPLTSQYLNLVKNSSLAIAVGFPDLWSTAFTTLNQSGQAVQVFIIVMAAYLTFSLLISFLLNWYNRRIALVER